MTTTPVPGATSVAVGPTATGVGLVSGDTLVYGWSLEETAGAAAEAWLLDGNDPNNGTPFAFITLSAGQSVRDVTATTPIWCQSGVVLRVVSGTVRAAVWYVDL